MPKPAQARRTLAPQGRPPGIYLSKYDPELGAAICRRVADGESLRAICRTDREMPTGKTVWNWRRAHEEFDEMLGHAQGVARERALAAQAGRDAARRAAWAQPGRRTAWNAGLNGFMPEIEDEICVRLMMGEALSAICRDPQMPSVATVYNWLRANPGFVAAYREARIVQAETLMDLAADSAPRPGRGVLRALDRHFKAARRVLGLVKLRRYAPPSGPPRLTVALVVAGQASGRVLYERRRGDAE
ncbi:MAG TPA: hypothetical protein VHV27_04685 [Phenylobacterium sp.]|nr:hypothetical protein [Phenylobacterium sp.]